MPRALRVLVATKFQLPFAALGADTADVVLSTTGAERLPRSVPVPVAWVVEVAATLAYVAEVSVPEKRPPVPDPVKARSPIAAPPVPLKPVIVPLWVVVPVPEKVTSIFMVPVETE